MHVEQSLFYTLLYLPDPCWLKRSFLGSFGLHLESHGFTWTHLDSLELIWIPVDSLGFNRIHLDSLRLTGTHLDSFGISWSHLESRGVTWTDLDWNSGTHPRIQAFIERCRTGTLVRNRTSSFLGQLRAVNPATYLTSVLWIRLPPPNCAPHPPKTVLNPHPTLPQKQCWCGSGSNKKKERKKQQNTCLPNIVFGGRGGLGQSDQKRVRQQSEVKYVAGWIDF